MLAEVGLILVGLALAAALYTAIAAFLGLRRTDRRWALSARNGIYAATGLLGLALLALLTAFLGDQFQIRYVAQHSNRDLPLYLKASAVWADRRDHCCCGPSSRRSSPVWWRAALRSDPDR